MSASGLCTEWPCQQNRIYPPQQTDHLFWEHRGSFLAALNNSKGPTTVISKRKDRDLEGEDM